MSQGRPRHRYPVESALRLDIARLARKRFFRPGSIMKSRWRWSYPWGDEGEADIVVNNVGDVPRVLVDWGDGDTQDIALDWTPQAYGGVRWWMLCPFTRRRCRVLYLPNGGRLFASRRAYRLVYRTQQMSPEGRAWHRVHKLSAAIGTCYEADEWEKPKGMHWRTFDRKAHALDAAHAALDRYFLLRCARFPGIAELIEQLR